LAGVSVKIDKLISTETMQVSTTAMPLKAYKEQSEILLINCIVISHNFHF